MSTEFIDRAYEELAEAKKAARAGRNAFRAEPILSLFVRTMRKAMQLYRDARAQGIAREDARRGLEEELRGAWPKSVSKFRPNCDACDDTGYREMACWDQQRCFRKVCAANPEKQHSYVVPCECPKGDRFRPRTFTSGDELTAVGKTRKKRGWRQVGS